MATPIQTLADGKRNNTNDPSCLLFEDWLKSHRFGHTDFTIAQLAATASEKKISTTVIVPGKEVASTIGGVLDYTIKPLVDGGVVTAVVVVDAASKDGTGEVAARHGARVIQRANIAAEMGASRGKGDALWRGLLATDGDIVAFLDGDTSDPSPAHLLGILGPLIMNDDIHMVRACFDRPFKSTNGEVRPHEGGRVTEILARPILNLYWPDLAGFRQPLAGEFAGRRSLLESLSIPVGYGIEIGTLVDTYRRVGLQGLAEVDVGQRQNAHKPLRELTAMAGAVLTTAERRVERGAVRPSRIFLPWENDFRDVDTTERPPLVEYRQKMALGEPEQLATSTRVYPSPPFVPVEGVRMFRDIGGYPTISGKYVRRKLVYRSGELSNMTKTGKEAFAELGIKHIFDLRSPIEKSEQGIHGPDDHLRRKDSAADINKDEIKVKCPYTEVLEEKAITCHDIAVFADSDWAPEERQTRLQSYANAAEGYAIAYRHTLLQGRHAYRAIFQHLAGPSPSPMLVHCSAGKDRTGIVAMLVLLLAGCDASTIAGEYALNNLDSDGEWGAGAVARLLRQPGLSGNIDAVKNVVQAKEEYMLRTVDMFGEEFGAIEGYLMEQLGFDEDAVGQMKENLLVDEL